MIDKRLRLCLRLQLIALSKHQKYLDSPASLCDNSLMDYYFIRAK